MLQVWSSQSVDQPGTGNLVLMALDKFGKDTISSAISSHTIIAVVARVPVQLIIR